MDQFQIYWMYLNYFYYSNKAIFQMQISSIVHASFLLIFMDSIFYSG